VTSPRTLSKVPEVLVWFWIIKILCTTVGESFADWISTTVGLGLTVTAILFTVVMAAVLALQLSLRRYVPAVYWLTVVVLSITGTLYTDILTDLLGVPLWASTTVFAALLAVVFGVWYARERTLSIHSITTMPREAFYWLAVLVTFALGTAAGDGVLQLTGWGPGAAVLLPLTLIALVAVLWRVGANAVLCFWIAYILTRPLGANIGDWLATPTTDRGLGLGTLWTSVLFLAAIVGIVVYVSVTGVDVVERRRPDAGGRSVSPARARLAAVGLAVVGVATIGLLAFAGAQPHESALAAEGPATTCSGAALTPEQARAAARAHFPASDLADLHAIVSDAGALVTAGDPSAARARITDLETAWDDAQPALQAADCGAWTTLDGQVDKVLSAVRSTNPDATTQTQRIQELLASLAG
jgi:uncharacterized membrane-anchored protein